MVTRVNDPLLRRDVGSHHLAMPLLNHRRMARAIGDEQLEDRQECWILDFRVQRVDQPVDFVLGKRPIYAQPFRSIVQQQLAEDDLKDRVLALVMRV